MSTAIVAAVLGAPSVLAAQKSAAPAASMSLAPLKVIDARYMNRKANACVDFNDFANGAWLATDTIPAAFAARATPIPSSR